MPFAGWLTGIAIYTFIQEMILKEEPAGNKKTNITFPKTYQKNLLEDSILNLPNGERYFAVFHFLEKYSLEETAGFLGITTLEAQDLYNKTIQHLIESADYVYSPDQLISRIESLPYKIEPSPEVWDKIVSRIREEKNQIHQKKMEEAVEEGLQENISAEQKDLTEPQKKKKEKKKKEKRAKIKRTSNLDLYLFKRAAVWISGFVILFLIIYLIFFTGGISWEVNDIKGTVTINGKTTLEETSLNPGETVTSKENSGFRLDISNIGIIKASANTSIQYDSDSTLQLANGNILVLKEDDSALLTVELSSAIIKDARPGGEYELQYVKDLYTTVKNNSGWTKIISGETEYYLLPGYICEIKENDILGIPYHYASSEEVKKLLYQFSHTSEDKDDIVDRLIILSRNTELVSLWNILKLASPMKRGDIYDYFAKLIIMPPSITKEGIIYLKSEMMMNLLKELELALEI